MSNPNDIVRSQILQHFYDRNLGATSRFGKKGSAAKISDVKRELKDKHNLTQQQVMSNLTYLIDKGWINVDEVEKTVQVRGGTVPSTVAWYEISSSGIDKIEGESEFKEGARWAGININASGSIVTLGDGNVVHATHAQLHGYLDELEGAVRQSESLEDETKLEVIADLEALKDQLVKENPEKSVVRGLWSSIEKVVTGAEFIDYATRIAPLVIALAAR